MKCPKCNSEQPDDSLECTKCGIVFEKYLARQGTLSKEIPAPEQFEPPADEEKNIIEKTTGLAKDWLLYVESKINPFYFGGRVLVFLIIIIWGLKFIFTPMESNYTGRSFLHMINLPFHEAGHIIFSPFGEFLSVLGGSLMQLLIPLICFFVFIIKTKDTFAASVSLWWLGQSFMDLAPYINDARELKLILLGGVTGREVPGYHDWEFILTKLGLLRHDHTLADISNTIGILLMLTTFIWAGYLLFKQFKNLDLD